MIAPQPSSHLPRFDAIRLTIIRGLIVYGLCLSAGFLADAHAGMSMCGYSVGQDIDIAESYDGISGGECLVEAIDQDVRTGKKRMSVYCAAHFQPVANNMRHYLDSCDDLSEFRGAVKRGIRCTKLNSRESQWGLGLPMDGKIQKWRNRAKVGKICEMWPNKCILERISVGQESGFAAIDAIVVNAGIDSVAVHGEFFSQDAPGRCNVDLGVPGMCAGRLKPPEQLCAGCRGIFRFTFPFSLAQLYPGGFYVSCD